MSLPDWPGAEVAYERAYRILEAIAEKYAKSNTKKQSWKSFNNKKGWPFPEVNCFIDALNQGDEEAIKGTILQYRTLGYLP